MYKGANCCKSPPNVGAAKEEKTFKSAVKYAGVGLGNVESTDFEFRLIVSAPSAVLFSSIF